MFRLGAVLLVLAGLNSFGWGQTSNPAAAAPAQGSVSGTIAYRERIALPPNAAIEVKVQDVSLQDAAAKTIAETVFSPEGKQVPIPFQLSYNPADINQAHTYQVRANITVNGKLMFTSTTRVSGDHAGRAVAGGDHAAAGTGPAGGCHRDKLTGTKWVLAEVNGSLRRRARANRFILCCTRKGRSRARPVATTWSEATSRRKARCSSRRAATTMKMCAAPVMEQEQAVQAALKATTAYKIDGTTLELLNGDKSLAKFDAEGK